jgi:uncharacterized protein YsxB (DUF464 family)
MSNNVFYKALAAVSTVGIVVIAGIQVTTALKKVNNAEDQLAKTMVEIKNARKAALIEVKSFRSDVLKELDTVRSNSLKEVRTDRSNALIEVKAAKAEALKSIAKVGGSKDGSVWLVLRYGNLGANSLSVIPMNDMDECQFQGAIWESSKNVSRSGSMGFECLEGK